jgi:hypothetical protein
MFCRFKLLFLSLVFCISVTQAQRKREMLVSSYPVEFVQKHLSPGTEWVKFPAYKNRDNWNAIPPVYKQRLIEEGESVLNYKWQVVPASAYLEFVKSGDRNVMQDVYSHNTTALRKLVLAELVEGKGRFLKQVVDGVWSICEMTTWELSAHLYMQKAGVGLPDIKEPVIDLGVGSTSVLLAWTNYFFSDEFNKINPLISQRILYEINRQVLQPYYSRDDFWWMALQKEGTVVNNWNIWLNYNVLTCILLTETDPQKRLKGLYKTMRSSDKFINYYKDDGGCEEGPSYWSAAGGMLFNYLHLLSEATQGAINKFNEPLVKNIGTYITKAYINDHYYINYADASAKLSPDAGLIYNYGKAVGDTLMKDFGSYLAAQQNWKEKIPGETLQLFLRNIFEAGEIINGPREKPLLKENWMAQTQIMTARDQAGSTIGFYFSALGGHNGESHNHNDVGSCILFYNGEPVLIDIGSENYTRQTFGPERYTIWTMQSAYHNLPLINGVQQHEGSKYAARDPKFVSDPSSVKFSLDIAGAYPEEAAVKKWQRTYFLKRKKSFTITDTYQLSSNKGKNELHFMTSNMVEKIKDGLLRLKGDSTSLDLQYNPEIVTPVIEPIEIKDSRLLQSWPKNISRIIFTFNGNKISGSSSLIFTATSKN